MFIFITERHGKIEREKRGFEIFLIQVDLEHVRFSDL